jgi:hypothetical protein
LAAQASSDRMDLLIQEPIGNENADYTDPGRLLYIDPSIAYVGTELS